MKRSMRSALQVAAVLWAACLAPRAARGWDVRCVPPEGPPEAECPDPFANARTPWDSHPLAEHRLLLETSMQMAGLPAFLRDEFELTVYTGSEELSAAGGDYLTIRPVASGAEREQSRRLTIQMMASLPDFSYTLWDWASGNELCPPDPANPSALDCHNYESHIGWLNSNHMLPQARHWYGYLHGLAVERAGACRDLADGLPEPDRTRFFEWLLACEKEALLIEGVAQHYLQDAWAIGHMIERWGSTEIADFGGDRALGFAVSGFVGALHGSKAMLDEEISIFAPWDDPLNAPHADVAYLDALDGPVPLPGVGDRFLPQLLGVLPGLDDYTPQREALFGCAIDGLREVYATTAQLHGGLGPAQSGFDARRQVEDDSCWEQRATNRAFDTGIGIHRGHFDGILIKPLGGVTAWTLGDVLGDFLLDAPQLSTATLLAFRRDMGMLQTRARLRARIAPDDNHLASGVVPSLAGIGPNSRYARGGPGVPPAGYSDPLLPWGLSDPDPAVEERKRALNLTFADAHAADRCGELDEADLLAYVDAAQQAAGGDPEVAEAACGQCVQMIAPHLRFGVEGSHDANREALCALVAEPPLAPAFLYTGEAGPFTGSEPDDLASLRSAARARCCTGGGGGDLSGSWGGTCLDAPDGGDPVMGFCQLNIAQNGADLSGTLEFCGADTTILFSATASGASLSNVVLENQGGCVVTGSGSVSGDELTTVTTGACDGQTGQFTIAVTKDAGLCP